MRCSMRFSALALVLAIPMFATACSDSNEEYAHCAEVWQAGQQLPDSYQGCREDKGSPVGAAWYECADGSWVYVYADDWYTRDGVVHVGEGRDSTFEACDGVLHRASDD
jgi:hypothetical protein